MWPREGGLVVPMVVARAAYGGSARSGCRVSDRHAMVGIAHQHAATTSHLDVEDEVFSDAVLSRLGRHDKGTACGPVDRDDLNIWDCEYVQLGARGAKARRMRR